MSASPHKRSDLELKLAEYGQTVKYAIPPIFCEELDIVSPVGGPIKTVKFLKHPDVVEQINRFEIVGPYWAFAMDVNGIAAGNKSSKLPAEVLTTCRGKVESVVKTVETARCIAERRYHKSDWGRIVFDNLCGPVKIDNGKIMDVNLFMERSMLCLSPNLLRVMSDERLWRKVVEASDGRLEVRPVDNAGATGGVDWTVLGYYLKIISNTLNLSDLDIVWQNSRYSKKYKANENGVDHGLTPNITSRLRGFPEKTVRGIARLN